MRKFLAIALALAVGVCFFAGTASADPDDMNTKEVQVEVLGTISMQEDAGPQQYTIQLTDVTVVVPFRVDANMESVFLKIWATDLYKADQSGIPYFLPLRTAENATIIVGEYIDPQTGILAGGSCVQGCLNDLNNTGGTLAFSGTTSDVGPDGQTWTWATSDEGLFESGHRGHFSHDLDVELVWGNDDAELPKGFYSGYVKMFGRLGPF